MSKHKLYHRLKWKKLVEPAIKLARDGYRVGRNSAAKVANYVACNDSSRLAELLCIEGQEPKVRLLYFIFKNLGFRSCFKRRARKLLGQLVDLRGENITHHKTTPYRINYNSCI